MPTENAGAGAAAQAPRLGSAVRDEADLLLPAQEARLTEIMHAAERRTHHQLGIATVTSLAGQDVDAYSLAFAERWALGRRGHDDGVMLLVAPNERKMRIEVGRGLEGVLTDEICAAILRDEVAPPFEKGDFARGIAAGVQAILARLDP
jgi:uncharacterized protein